MDHADWTTDWNPSIDVQNASKRNIGFAQGMASKRSDSGAWSEQSVDKHAK
jgi:hypothetical protein